MVVFRDEGSFEPTVEMLRRENRTLDLGGHMILPY